MSDSDQTAFNLRGGDRAHEANPTEENEMSEATTSEVATKGESGVALPMASLMAEQGSGLEEVGSDDVAIPYLSILQKMSAAVEKSDPGYIEGATPGMFHNTVSGELYDGEEGLLVVPCYFRAVYTEQGPGKRGKFIAEHPVSWPEAAKTTRNSDRQDVLPNGNVVVRKNRHYLMLAWQEEPVVLTCKSTALRTSKAWNSQLAARKMDDGKGGTFIPPTFSTVWRLTTVRNENDEGVWYTPSVKLVNDLADPDLFEKCRQFAAVVRGGQVTEEGDEG